MVKSFVLKLKAKINLKTFWAPLAISVSNSILAEAMQARQLQNSTSKLQIINAHLYPEIQTIPIMTTQVVSVDHCQMAIIIISIHTHTQH